MTALENTLESAYPEKTNQIAPRAIFKKFEKAVRALIKQRGFPQALREKLPELNRPYLLEKITKYINDREIVIDDFPKNALKEIIKARNAIVHQGIYFDYVNPTQVDVWEHVMVARELVVRIFLKVLRFEGNYFSLLHEGKQLRFPSCRVVP